MSSIDNDEERAMHSKSDNIKIMINDEANKVIKELFDSFKNRYVYLLYCKCHKVNPNHGGSFRDSPGWIKSKKSAINIINKKIINNFNML